MCYRDIVFLTPLKHLQLLISHIKTIFYSINFGKLWNWSKCRMESKWQVVSWIFFSNISSVIFYHLNLLVRAYFIIFPTTRTSSFNTVKTSRERWFWMWVEYFWKYWGIENPHISETILIFIKRSEKNFRLAKFWLSKICTGNIEFPKKNWKINESLILIILSVSICLIYLIPESMRSPRKISEKYYLAYLMSWFFESSF